MSTPSSRASRRTDGAAGAAGAADASGSAGCGGCAARAPRLMSTTSPRGFCGRSAAAASSSPVRPGTTAWLSPPSSGAPSGCGFGFDAPLSTLSSLSSLSSLSPGAAPFSAFAAALAPPRFSSAGLSVFSAAGAAFSAAPPAPSLSVRTTCPTLTLSPVLTFTSPTVPLTFDGTSMVALSVSSSSTG